MENTIINLPSQEYTLSYITAVHAVAVSVLLVSVAVGYLVKKESSLLTKLFPGMMVGLGMVLALTVVVGAGGDSAMSNAYLKSGLPAQTRYELSPSAQETSEVMHQAFDAQVVSVNREPKALGYTWYYILKDNDGDLRQCEAIQKGPGSNQGVPVQFRCDTILLTR